MRKAILIVYRRIELPVGSPSPRFAHTLSDGEIRDAVESFEQFPRLATELTGGLVSVDSEVAEAERTLTTLTPVGREQYWPSPDDVRPELDTLAPAGRYDSVFIFWPQTNLMTAASIPSPGWGLAIAASEWSNWATYATVANAHTDAWKVPKIGEVWLHEWLHGVCGYYAELGYPMPDGDADGGARHGYERSPETGWTKYYRDLMTGNVLESGRLVGIPPQAWRRWRRD